MSGPKLRFCPESHDLLYPKEDREHRKLIYVCRSCSYQEDADHKDWCVYRNEVHHTTREKSVVLQVRFNIAIARLSASDYFFLCRQPLTFLLGFPSTYSVPQDVRSDPTLPRTNDVRCPACSHNEAVFFSASTEEGMTLFFNCTNCGHRWRDYV
jgi:DNA-directed RNA polymerase II subunit RPB9